MPWVKLIFSKFRNSQSTSNLPVAARIDAAIPLIDVMIALSIVLVWVQKLITVMIGYCYDWVSGCFVADKMN